MTQGQRLPSLHSMGTQSMQLNINTCFWCMLAVGLTDWVESVLKSAKEPQEFGKPAVPDALLPPTQAKAEQQLQQQSSHNSTALAASVFVSDM